MSDARDPRQPYTIVLPVFNEQDGLRAVLDELFVVLGNGAADCEIIVVDDGSTDGTPTVLGACKGIVAIRHETNRGYGAALKAGIAIAKNPVVVIMDSDGTYPAGRIPALAEGCAAADMVVGARRMGVRPTAIRRAVKWFFRQLAQMVAGVAIPDLNSGLRAMRRSTLNRFVDLLPNGFSFTTTATVASLMSDLTVKFEPIEYRPRIGRSKFHPIRDTYRIGRQIFRVGLRLSPVRTVSIVAVPFLAAVTAHMGGGGIGGCSLAFILAATGVWLVTAPNG